VLFGAAAAASPLLGGVAPSFAQGRKSPRVEQHRSVIASTLTAAEARIESAKEVLRNGSPSQVQALLHGAPSVPHYERMSTNERLSVFPNFSMGYITEQASLETGKMSFPMTASFCVPKALYDANRYVPTIEEIMKDPRLMEYDGSPRFWNTIRVGKYLRISPGHAMYEAREFDESILRRVQNGEGVFSIKDYIFPPYDNAGVLTFDASFAQQAAGKAVSLVWLRLPEKVETDGIADALTTHKLRRKAEMSSAMLYELDGNAALRSFVEQSIRSAGSERNPRFLYYRDIQLASLSRARLVVMNSTDIYHFERTMQQVGGAGVVKSAADGKPYLIGQVLWQVYIPSNNPASKPRIGFIVSDVSSTEQAVNGTT
jgi:hypothetical protein